MIAAKLDVWLSRTEERLNILIAQSNLTFEDFDAVCKNLENDITSNANEVCHPFAFSERDALIAGGACARCGAGAH